MRMNILLVCLAVVAATASTAAFPHPLNEPQPQDVSPRAAIEDRKLKGVEKRVYVDHPLSLDDVKAMAAALNRNGKRALLTLAAELLLLPITNALSGIINGQSHVFPGKRATDTIEKRIGDLYPAIMKIDNFILDTIHNIFRKRYIEGIPSELQALLDYEATHPTGKRIGDLYPTVLKIDNFIMDALHNFFGKRYIQLMTPELQSLVDYLAIHRRSEKRIGYTMQDIKNIDNFIMDVVHNIFGKRSIQYMTQELLDQLLYTAVHLTTGK